MSSATRNRFEIGDRVRVDDRAHEGHHRTPWYIKGKTGIVVYDHGGWVNPETRAYGASGLPEISVYRVLFDQADLWDTYDGPAGDTLIVDVFEHWIEPDNGEGTP